MQEDIDHRAVALVINTTKMTGRALKSAITKYLAHCRQKAKAPPTGRQTVRELVGQGQGVTNIEITEGNIRSFERVARKYGVDYALKKDREKPRYLVFFKAKDADALTAAFEEYTARSARREERRNTRRERRRETRTLTRPNAHGGWNVERETQKNGGSPASLPVRRAGCHLPGKGVADGRRRGRDPDAVQPA